MENISGRTPGRRGGGIDSHKLLPVFVGAVGQLVLAFPADRASAESRTGTRVVHQYLAVRTCDPNGWRRIVLLGVELLLRKWTSAMDSRTTVARKAVFETPTFHSWRAPDQCGGLFFGLFLGLEEAITPFSRARRASQDRHVLSHLGWLELLKRFTVGRHLCRCYPAD